MPFSFDSLHLDADGEPSKTLFRRLLAHVEIVNPEAADWLRKNPPLKDEQDDGYKSLITAMVWSVTPQGYRYWGEIYSQLMQLFPGEHVAGWK